MGIYNSSLTRVRPFFRELLKHDPTGAEWLPSLLALPHDLNEFARIDLLVSPGPLRPANIEKEKRLPPPGAFLGWLIEHPEKMTWPKGGSAQFGPETQYWREKLMGRRDLSRESFNQHTYIRQSDREEAIKQGLRELSRKGPSGSTREWWAFEGYTSVDCFLETDKLRIYIEGKRTDVPSSSTEWYRNRNQLLRNLESAREDAGAVPFVCIVIAEQRLPVIDNSLVLKSLPHLSDLQRKELMRNFLGSTTWVEACQATGVDYNSLPATV